MTRLLLAAAVLLTACAKKEPEKKKDRPEETKAAPWKKDLTRDCPAYAQGAAVAVDDTTDGVRVTITGPDGVVDEIRGNARYLEGASAAGAGADALDFGGGPTGNRNANCPVVLDDTTLKVAEVAGGVTIDVTPRAAANLATLRETARERLDTLNVMKEAMGR